MFGPGESWPRLPKAPDAMQSEKASHGFLLCTTVVGVHLYVLTMTVQYTLILHCSDTNMVYSLLRHHFAANQAELSRRAEQASNSASAPPMFCAIYI